MDWKRYAVMAVLLFVAGCGNQKGSPVYKNSLGDNWPLTVSSGRLSCDIHTEKGQIVTFITADGKEYALNGNANKSKYFLPIDLIQKPEPKNPRAKMNIGLLLDEGLRRCPY